MKLAEARIGYAGYSPDLRGPGDRRRFLAYAARRSLPFERAHVGHDYDLVLATHNGDIAGWTHRKRRDGARFKFVFELVDSYFNQVAPARRWLKGIARYLLGMDSRLSPDFLRTLIQACETADAVICSTEEQRDAISRYNRNVHISFDWVDPELGAPKSDYSRCGKLKLVWEGQSTTLPNLQLLRGMLNRFHDQVELHVVTDPLIYRHFGKYGPFPAREALRGINCDIIFHDWDASTFSAHIVACDLAIIPIDGRNRFWWGKPENKLVLLWKLGMPVLATATPVYRRVMTAAGSDLLCQTEAQWASALQAILEGPSAKLETIGQACRSFANRHYSEGEFLGRFDAVFRSVGFDTN